MTNRKQQEKNEISAHPLFPLDEDAPEDAQPAEVASIHVRRLDGGEWRTVPAAFAPEQLLSWEQVWSMFGGGKYELIARGSGGRITQRETEVLPGPSKSLAPSEHDAESPPPPPPPAAVVGAELGGTMGLLLQMMQAQQAQSQALFLAFLERSDRAAATQQATMTQMFTQSSQLMASIFQGLSEQKSSSDPAEVFLRGVETSAAIQAGARAQAPAAGSDSGLGDILETVRTVAQGVQAAQQAPTTLGAIADTAAALQGGTQQ